MLANKLAQTYAKALCAIAEEKNMLDKFEFQLKQAEGLFKENPDLYNLLHHPRVPKKVKMETVDTIFSGELDELLKNFLLLLVEKRREMAFHGIVNEYVKLANIARNIVEVEVTLVRDISDKQKQALADKLAQVIGKKITLKINFDEAILGGVIIRIGDKLIDGSVVRQLETLKSNILSQRLNAG
jgi:F-type H+-transporting ATPase subunit delta